MLRQSKNVAPASLPIDRVRKCLQASRPPVKRQARLKMATYLTRSLHASMSPRHEGLRWTHAQSTWSHVTKYESIHGLAPASHEI